MSASDTFHHVRDFPYVELPGGYHLPLPAIPLPFGDFQLTKFMLLQTAAFLFCLFVFNGLSRRISTGQPVKGRFWNFWEAIALFIRDEVVRPTIGDDHHDHDPLSQELGHGEHAHPSHEALEHGGHSADKYLPFLWSCFFFILICNLLGAIPFLGSATGNINVTAVLAICAFVMTIYYGFQAMGPAGFFGNMMPDTGIPGPAGKGLSIGIFGIELFGFLVKHAVLAVRLFANIMGGHTVLGVILGFIALGATKGFLWGPITAGSIAMMLFISALELFVAFLQAYVFTFLATIFIASAVHKH